MATTNHEQQAWLFASFSKRYFHTHPVLLHRHDRWRRTAHLLRLSRVAQHRLEWMIFWENHHQDVSMTCRHFGIARKTFYTWLKRFNTHFLHGLEDQSKAPHRTRQREYTARQYERIVQLRRQYVRYGKMKLLALYQQQYPQDTAMSAWKVQCIIQASGIYYQPLKQARINRKRARSVQRKKITDLRLRKTTGFLLCLDTIVRYWNGQKRYILTAIDRHTKVAFARMYASHSSAAARDFLYRLHYLLDGKIDNIQTDNGSEFHKYFDSACTQLQLDHYWSRVKTPKDNAVNERFNRTLQEEFIQLGHMTMDTTVFNRQTDRMAGRIQLQTTTPNLGLYATHEL